jgi:hypothetical protein
MADRLEVASPARNSVCQNAAGIGSVGQPASHEDIVLDANRFALSYVRDFRVLHQFNHDHDCTTTCIKYVAKQCRDTAQEALKKGKVVACRFSFFHILVFNYVATTLDGLTSFSLFGAGTETRA